MQRNTTLNRPWPAILLLAALAALAGCNPRGGQPAKTEAPARTEASAPAQTPATAKAPAPNPMPESAPDVFKVRFELSNGVVVAQFHKDWAPIGVEHFHQLVKMGYLKRLAGQLTLPIRLGGPF